MQDFTGVPAIVDLAAMRDAMEELGSDPGKINPLVPVDLIIDHSVQVDAFGNPRAFDINADRDYERNGERYAFLRWGQQAFDSLRVVPPATGICHQVNLEYLGQVVCFKLTGELSEGATATDLVLTVTEMLRERGVVGKFVEFFGPGLHTLGLADRATIGNMSPEFGSTCAIFPIDVETLRYLEFTGRPTDLIELVDAYAREQGLFHAEDSGEPTFSETLELDLTDVEPSIAGPKRPQDRIPLSQAKSAFIASLREVADEVGNHHNDAV